MEKVEGDSMSMPVETLQKTPEEFLFTNSSRKMDSIVIFLDKNMGTAYTSAEIAKECKINQPSVYTMTKKLLDKQKINRKGSYYFSKKVKL